MFFTRCFWSYEIISRMWRKKQFRKSLILCKNIVVFACSYKVCTCQCVSLGGANEPVEQTHSLPNRSNTVLDNESGQSFCHAASPMPVGL